MIDLHELLSVMGSTVDIIFDPNIGPMELQELGIKERLEFNGKDGFAYAQNFDIPELSQLISDMAYNLRIYEGESKIVDKITEKVYKSFVDYMPLSDNNGYWVTLWYDAKIGHLHRQEKIEILIKPHRDEAPHIFEFYEIKNKVWINNIANELKKDYPYGIELEQLKEYIKNKDLLWLLEDLLHQGYDLWGLVEDINQKIEE